MRIPRLRAPEPSVSVVCPVRPATPDPWVALRRLLAEALIFQDAAEELLVSLHDRPDPADVARSCGRLNRRFVELRGALPSCEDPELERYTAALRNIFDHHILMLKTSVGFLAGAERCELLAERLDAIDGLGRPARRLEAIRADVLRRTGQPPI